MPSQAPSHIPSHDADTTPMLDRYLQSVATFLPSKNRDDILAELRANLTSEMETIEETTGTLTEDQQTEVLRRHGHPTLVASRYFPQRYLIGPEWMASYWFILRIALVTSAAVVLSISLVQVALEKISAGHLLALWLSYPATALNVFAWVTLFFATADYFANRYHWKEAVRGAQWDPRKLPYIKFGGAQKGSSPKQEFFGACVGLVILVAARGLVTVAAIAGRHGVGLVDPAWSTLYQVLLAAAILSVLAAFWRLLRPDLQSIQPVSGLLTTSIIVLALADFHHHGPWLVSLGTNAAMTAKVPAFNVVLHWLIVAWIVGMSIPALTYAWQCAALLRSTGKSAKMHPAIL